MMLLLLLVKVRLGVGSKGLPAAVPRKQRSARNNGRRSLTPPVQGLGSPPHDESAAAGTTAAGFLPSSTEGKGPAAEGKNPRPPAAAVEAGAGALGSGLAVLNTLGRSPPPPDAAGAGAGGTFMGITREQKRDFGALSGDNAAAVVGMAGLADEASLQELSPEAGYRGRWGPAGFNAAAAAAGSGGGGGSSEPYGAGGFPSYPQRQPGKLQQQHQWQARGVVGTAGGGSGGGGEGKSPQGGHRGMEGGNMRSMPQLKLEAMLPPGSGPLSKEGFSKDAAQVGQAQQNVQQLAESMLGSISSGSAKGGVAGDGRGVARGTSVQDSSPEDERMRQLMKSLRSMDESNPQLASVVAEHIAQLHQPLKVPGEGVSGKGTGHGLPAAAGEGVAADGSGTWGFDEGPAMQSFQSSGLGTISAGTKVRPSAPYPLHDTSLAGGKGVGRGGYGPPISSMDGRHLPPQQQQLAGGGTRGLTGSISQQQGHGAGETFRAMGGRGGGWSGRDTSISSMNMQHKQSPYPPVSGGLSTASALGVAGSRGAPGMLSSTPSIPFGVPPAGGPYPYGVSSAGAGFGALRGGLEGYGGSQYGAPGGHLSSELLVGRGSSGGAIGASISGAGGGLGPGSYYGPPGSLPGPADHPASSYNLPPYGGAAGIGTGGGYGGLPPVHRGHAGNLDMVSPSNKGGPGHAGRAGEGTTGSWYGSSPPAKMPGSAGTPTGIGSSNAGVQGNRGPVVGAVGRTGGGGPQGAVVGGAMRGGVQGHPGAGAYGCGELTNLGRESPGAQLGYGHELSPGRAGMEGGAAPVQGFEGRPRGGPGSSSVGLYGSSTNPQAGQMRNQRERLGQAGVARNVGTGLGQAAPGSNAESMSSAANAAASAAMIAALVDPSGAGSMQAANAAAAAAAAGNYELLMQIPGFAEVLNRVGGNPETPPPTGAGAAAGVNCGSGAIASHGSGGSDDAGGAQQQ